MRKKFGLGGGVLTLGGIKKAVVKKIAKTAAERKDQLLNIIKKRKTRKLFGKSRLKQKTIKLIDETGKTGKPFKDESKIMDIDTYDKIKNMSDKNVTSQLKQAGFKDK